MPPFVYRPEIDGLRAIAVLAVVLFHADLGVAAGQVGVDVFFVISGYLITALLHREWSATGHINFPAFYARRIRRILPALIVVIGVTVALSAWLLSRHGDSTDVAKSAAASMLFVGNVFFDMNTGGYFGPTASHWPLLHLWSLGVEEQFYMFWPFYLAALLRRNVSPIPVVLMGILASFVLAEALIFLALDSAFYEMPARFWELACGGIIALRTPRLATPANAQAMVGLVIILFAMNWPIAHFPGIGAAPAVLGAVLLLDSIHRSSDIGPVGRLLKLPPMRLIGRISYSVYLWHWPLLALAHNLHPGILPPSLRVGLCVLSIALGWLSYVAIEQPLRNARHLKTSNRNVVGVGMLISLSLALVMNVMGDELYVPPPLPDQVGPQIIVDAPQNTHRCHYLDLAPLDDFPRMACATPADKPLRVVIWGDSRALAWQPFARAIAKEYDVAAINYSRDACQPALNDDNHQRFREAALCRQFNSLAVNHLNGIDTLIIAAAWPSPDDRPEFANNFAETMKKIAPLIKRIIIIGPTPKLRDTVPRCIEANDLSACAISRDEFDATTKPIKAMLANISSHHPNIEIVDPTEFFCDPANCFAVKDNFGLYWDNSHVSWTAASRFADEYIQLSKDAASFRPTVPKMAHKKPKKETLPLH